MLVEIEGPAQDCIAGQLLNRIWIQVSWAQPSCSFYYFTIPKLQSHWAKFIEVTTVAPCLSYKVRQVEVISLVLGKWPTCFGQWLTDTERVNHQNQLPLLLLLKNRYISKSFPNPASQQPFRGSHKTNKNSSGWMGMWSSHKEHSLALILPAQTSVQPSEWCLLVAVHTGYVSSRSL